MVNNRYFLLSEGFLWWPSLSPWKGRDQGTLPTEPFFRLLEFWVLYSRKTLLKSKKISVEHALHVARIHGQQGFRPRYVFNYPLSLYYSMQKKIDLHQIRANFWHTRILLSVPEREMQLEEMSEIQANIKLWSKKVQTTRKIQGKDGKYRLCPWIYNPM